MKKTLLVPLLFFSVYSFGQNVIGSVNSSAISTNGMVFSVGEIYVIPTTNPDDANSGLMAVLSRVEMEGLGMDNIVAPVGVNVYPNPTSRSVFFEVAGSEAVRQISVFDQFGRLVISKPLVNNQLDLNDLTSGIYYLKTNLQNIPSIKIIKQ